MRLFAFFAAMVFCLFSTQSAHAKRGFAIVGYGMNVEKIETTPSSFTKKDGTHFDLGWAYNELSVFFMPIYASSSEGPVLYAKHFGDVTYIPVTPELRAEIAHDLGHDPFAGYSFSGWKHIWGLLIFLPLIAFAQLKKYLQASVENEGTGYAPDQRQAAPDPQNRYSPAVEAQPASRGGGDALIAQPRGFGRKGL